MENDGPTDSHDTSSLDVSAYADQLQRALRQFDEQGSDEWRALVERGLSEAYRQHDSIGLASMVQVVVSFLDATGRFDDAVTEIGHALRLARGDPDAIAMLEALRASFQAVTGRITPALESVAAAKTASQDAKLAEAIAKCRANCFVVQLIALDDVNLGEVDTLLGSGPDVLRESDALFLVSYLLPYLFARGERIEAHPRLRAFRLLAQAINHEWRVGDAAAMEAAEQAITEPLTAISLDSISRWNWLARWRVQVGRFRAAHLRRDLEACRVELAALLRARRRAGNADFDRIDAFEAYHQVLLSGGNATVSLEPPETLHLLNLPSVLAGAEAVALGGSQALAARWLSWLQDELPETFRTSLEWPVARARIEALLALRAGDHRGAKVKFEQALAWAQDAQYPCELALAQVQLGELLYQRAAGRERTWPPFRDEGWEALQSCGIDPAPYAYEVARLLACIADATLRPHLTRRELEVLGLLAEGLSYKATAERLSLQWPTVQVLAHRSYEKLGVSGRWPAVHAARELGML